MAPEKILFHWLPGVSMRFILYVYVLRVFLKWFYGDRISYSKSVMALVFRHRLASSGPTCSYSCPYNHIQSVFQMLIWTSRISNIWPLLICKSCFKLFNLMSFEISCFQPAGVSVAGISHYSLYALERVRKTHGCICIEVPTWANLQGVSLVIGNATFVQVWYTQASVLLVCHSGCVSPAAVREGNGAMPKRSERCCLMDSKLKMAT